MTDLATDILAKTIYGEARGEPLSGQEAVASVIMNRVAYSQKKGGYWWGNDVASVCQKPQQFSCWNTDDANYRIIIRANESDPIYATCKRIAKRAMAGVLEDRTYGATHYHNKKVRPRWSIGKIPCQDIGNHFFYNDVEAKC